MKSFKFMIDNAKSLNSIRVSMLINSIQDFSLSTLNSLTTTNVEDSLRELQDLLKAYFVLVELLNHSHLIASSNVFDSTVKDVYDARIALRKLLVIFFGVDWKQCGAANLLPEINQNN